MIIKGLVLFDDFAAGDFTDDVGAGVEEDLPFARFKVDGAVYEGVLAKLEDLLAFVALVLLDGDSLELGVGKGGFLGEKRDGLEEGGMDGLEGAEDEAGVLDGGVGEVGLAKDFEGADVGALGEEASFHVEGVGDGGAVELEEAVALDGVEDDGAILGVAKGLGLFRGFCFLLGEERGDEAQGEEGENEGAEFQVSSPIFLGVRLGLRCSWERVCCSFCCGDWGIISKRKRSRVISRRKF